MKSHWNKLPFLLFACSLTILVGCVGMPGKDYPVSSETREIESAEEVSSELLDMMKIRGKVSEPGPLAGQCSGEDDGHFRVTHSWSVYEVPVPDLRRAMDRLKDGLAQRGWEIGSFGPDSSRAKSLTLEAESDRRGFGVYAQLLDRRGRSENPSMIYVSLSSQCYRKG